MMREYQDVVADLRDQTTPSPERVERLHRHLARRRRAGTPTRLALAGAGVVALAAAALFTLREPSLDRTFAGDAPVELGPHVVVTPLGAGKVSGTGKELAMTWERGTVAVEVEPGQGVQLAVTTEEATVRVVGTGFDVTRDALGTTVRVRHGKVAVSCRLGAELLLSAGQSGECAPPSAPGALRRVLALQDSLPPAALLAELDMALSRPDAAGPIAAELLALRAGTLVAAGRDAEALLAAETALREPGCTRPDEMHRMAARLRLAVADCGGALPHLRALEAAGSLGEDAPALLACASGPE